MLGWDWMGLLNMVVNLRRKDTKVSKTGLT